MKRIRALFRSTEGVAAIEFAILLPFLIVLILGVTDLTRLLWLEQKANKVAMAMADFTAQSSSLSRADMDRFMTIVPNLMRPFNNANTSVVVTAITSSNGAPPPCTGRGGALCVMWKYNAGPGGISVTGGPGGGTGMPGGLATQPGEYYMTAEVTYQYSPLMPLSGILVPPLAQRNIYKFAVSKPIYGMMSQLQ